MPPSSPDDYPKTFDYAEAAPRLYARWQEAGHFHSEPDPNREPFTMVIPPPNVTGALHLGHALNNTLQDVLIRFKRMQGFNTLWMPGADHAGIATQAVVERRLREEEGLTRHDLGREKLVERIWQWKDQYETRILEQLRQMGCSCDWERMRFTLDDVCAKAVRQTFFRLFRQGWIYRGKRLVNWDTFLQTAVSDDEVEHKEVKGHFWHFRYPVINPKQGEPHFVTIATTRPETMLGDTAVAVHPKPAGALRKLESELIEKLAGAPEKERSTIESELENVRRRRKEMLPQLKQLRDMAADGRKLMLPLLQREIPLIADPWAKPELGSGCVKITPAHDPNDYEVWQRHPEIGAINILHPDGTLNKNAGEYEGKDVYQARKAVVSDLDADELLGEVEDRLIDLAHSDRSKTPIEPYLADQWFVKMDDLAQQAIDAVNDNRVQIHPPRYAKSYLDWLGEKRDWCISRNLWWGHRIPIWAKPGATENEIPLILGEDAREEVVSTQIHFDEETSKSTLLVSVAPGHDDIEKKLEGAGFVQDDDVLDTWFSSALWPHSTFGWPEKNADLDYYYPTSVLSTSRDIISLWVARMVLSGLFNMDDVPFRDVFIHPKILDAYGETMSKSKGNGVDPADVIEKYGPDPMRYALAYITTDTQDVRMPVQFECPHCQAHIDQTKKNRELPTVTCPQCSTSFSTQWASREEDKAHPRAAVISERFELARNFCTKLWNASRFVLLQMEGYTSTVVTDDELTLEDRWILSRLATVTGQVTEALEGFHYAEAARTLYAFTWNDFCDYYVEIAKDRLQDEARRGVAQRVIVHLLDVLLRLLHPITPFVTEEIWQRLGEVAPERGIDDPEPAVDDLIVAPWPAVDPARQDASIEQRFATYQSTLGAVREIRSRQNIPPKKETTFSIRCDDATAELLTPMASYYASMANATLTKAGPDVQPPETHAHVSLPSLDVMVDLAGLIDKEKERSRLDKDREKLIGHIAGKEKKLANASFVDRAPAEVVAKERESLGQLREQLEAVEKALAALA